MHAMTYFIASEKVLNKIRESAESETEYIKVIKNEKYPLHHFNYYDADSSSFSYSCILLNQSEDVEGLDGHAAIFYRVYIVIWDGSMQTYSEWKRKIKDAQEVIGLGGRAKFLCFDLTGSFEDDESEVDIILIQEINVRKLLQIIDSKIKIYASSHNVSS